jgi:hypothetical protein
MGGGVTEGGERGIGREGERVSENEWKKERVVGERENGREGGRKREREGERERKRRTRIGRESDRQREV